MRPEFRWTLAAVAAFGLGAAFAEPYARLAAPYYSAVDRLIAMGHPWEIASVEVRPGKSSSSAELQLWAFVSRRPEDIDPAAKVQGRVQVGEVIETPLVFWTLLLVCPATSFRQRLLRLAIGVPVFLGLEAVTTAAQLIPPMAQASAILAGDKDPVTAWDYWSRCLEAGGQFVLACSAALIIASLVRGNPQSNSVIAS
jgi:hypothetical protein